MRHLRLTLLALLGALALSLPAKAAFETRAGAAYVLDQTTGTVLLEKNAETPLPPASMSKLMTLNMLFEALKDGRVTMDTRFNVSRNAMAMGGSTMFLDTTDRPTVEQLIKGIIVQSGNDACVVVAEGLAGTEAAFARAMNERAKALGLEDSTFANASGWPDPNQRMSMKDLGTLANRLITEFPEFYGFFGLEEFDYDGRAPQNRFNRNPLLGMGIGADGLKTGHTQAAGYGLVGSAVQGDRRVIVVISGLETAEARAQEGERLINWAFRQFVEKTVLDKGTRLTETEVWTGAAPRVGLVAPRDVTLVIPATLRDQLRAEIRFETPVIAPVEEGEELGELVIDIPDMQQVRVPLVAEAAVPKGGFLPRIRSAAQIAFARLYERAQDF